jgi:hypothetical protein
MKQFANDRDVAYSAMKGHNSAWSKFFGFGGKGSEKTASDMAMNTPKVASGYLKEIAENTKRTADYQRMILGGGEVGRAGATPVELHGLTGKEKRIAHAVRIIVDEMSSQSSVMQRAAAFARPAMT